MLEHVHSLSLEFHLKQKAGDVVGALTKAKVINRLLELLLLTIIPVSFDLILVFDWRVSLMIGLRIFLCPLWCIFRLHYVRSDAALCPSHSHDYESE